MRIHIYKDAYELGVAAGQRAAQLIKNMIAEKGHANIILATGTSQFQTLDFLVHDHAIDWSRVVMFHLDEYIGLTISHPASFRKYITERFLEKAPPLKEIFLISGEDDPGQECLRLNSAIREHPVDLALVGIGENGHLAFNDPPADFETEDPYIIVSLDEACRRQQVHEGWFQSLHDVPLKAISMSIRQIMKSKHIICSVPGERKAEAVYRCVQHPVSNLMPAGILQEHADCDLCLDKASAALLKKGDT
jgi:glucosamine-6-phosphate deaminase